MQLILASQSPRRAQILRDHGFDFHIEAADIDESTRPNESPLDYVKRVAQEKAKKVSKNYLEKNVCVLAADTTVVLKDKILGKPADHTEARQMLFDLSDTKHDVITGFAVFFTHTKKWIIDADFTEVTFQKLTAKQIEDYIKTGEPFDKAGAYGIQTVQNDFVKNIKGSFFNVMGLPIEKLTQIL